MKRVETNLVFKEEKETSREIFTKEKEKETYKRSLSEKYM
jgi:hypothetical protein